MFAQPVTKDQGALPVVTIPRMFLPDEIGWLANEARILRAFTGHEVWIEEPDLRPGPFRRLAYHPRLAAAVEEVGGRAALVESTTMLYARRGIVSPSAPYWRTPEVAPATGSLAVVFLGDAWLSIAEAGDGGFHRIEGASGDVVLLPPQHRRLTATTDGHLAPLFLVSFGNGPRLRGGRPAASPKFADDCLWQPPSWTAG